VPTLRKHAKKWAGQLAEAGLNLNLAPVADTVPASVGEKNAPIGQWHREYGYTPEVVGPHVAAVVRGFRAAGIAAAVKHFPGIGRATGNTDTAKKVTDPTRPDDPYLQPFQAGVDAGARFVMMSSARYPKIDKKHPACFSRTVIGTMLRTNLGFTGIVVSDSLDGAVLSRWSPAQRAILFLQAGGTMLLDAHAQQLVAMAQAIRTKMAASDTFAERVDAAVMLVLTEKAKAGLIG
jgi:beta-N-acetylhexosaminidase